MAPRATCSAHELIVSSMKDLKEGQDATIVLIREITKDSADSKTALALLTQDVAKWQLQNEKDIAEILRQVRRRKWTPGKVTALMTAVFGSGSAFTVILTWVLKIGGVK